MKQRKNFLPTKNKFYGLAPESSRETTQLFRQNIIDYSPAKARRKFIMFRFKQNITEFSQLRINKSRELIPFVVSFFFQNILFHAPALGSWEKILMFDPKTFRRMRRIRQEARDPKKENFFINFYSFIPDVHVNESIYCIIRRIFSLTRQLHVDRI